MTIRSYQLVNTTKLCGYALNSRKHSEKQIQQVADSITEFGFTAPILIDENNTIIAGHCRLEAAKKLRMLEVPCITLEGLSEMQKKAYIIADNKITMNADWDFAILKAEFNALEEANFNLDLTGFDVDEIATLFTPPEMPEIAKEDHYDAMSVEGSIWILGAHRLICGKIELNEADDIIRSWEISTNKKAIREN